MAEEDNQDIKQDTNEEMEKEEEIKEGKRNGEEEEKKKKEKKEDDKEEEEKEEKEKEEGDKEEAKEDDKEKEEEEGDKEEQATPKKRGRKKKESYVMVSPSKDMSVPLYDQPLETSGKRDRKKVERFVTANKKDDNKEIEANGKGTAFGDIPFIAENINRTAIEELKLLHRIAFNRHGSGVEIKRNLRKFNGFTFDKDDKKYEAKKMSLTKMYTAGLKRVLKLLGLEMSGKIDELKDRVMEYMMMPYDTGRKPSKVKSKRGRKPGSKAKRAKDEGASEASDDNSSSEEEQEEEEEEKKKKEKGGGRGRGRGRGRGGRGGGGRAKRARVADDDDDDSSDDEPLAKLSSKQPPSDAELKGTVKKLLEGANLEEVTMKRVCQEVYDKYPAFDLTHKKQFIKDTVRSIIS